MRIALSLVLVLLTGCTYYRSLGEPADAAPDDVSAPDATAAAPLTFRLSYGFSGGVAPLAAAPCDGTLFVQAADDEGLEGVVTVFDSAGGPVPMLPDCASCFCNDTEPTSACPAAAGQPAVTQLAFDEHIDWVWDGVTFPILVACAPGNRSCQGAVTAAAGVYLARFCYADDADGVGPGHHIGTPICEDVPFEYPSPTGIVERRVVCYGP